MGPVKKRVFNFLSAAQTCEGELFLLYALVICTGLGTFCNGLLKSYCVARELAVSTTKKHGDIVSYWFLAEFTIRNGLIAARSTSRSTKNVICQLFKKSQIF